MHLNSGRPRNAIALVLVLLALAGVSVVVRTVSSTGRSPILGFSYADARLATGVRPGLAVSAYPWAQELDPGALDPWGFPKRQCTSYVAWYLNAHGIPFARLTRGSRGVAHFGVAGNWAHAAADAGFAMSTTPRVGTVAHWAAGERSRTADAGRPYAGGGGHVAVVYRVLVDLSVYVAEYNGRTRLFQVRHDRAPRYLYIGVSP